MKNKTVLLINTQDYMGGAAQSTWRLYNGLLRKNINSFMAVHEKITNDESIKNIYNNIVYKLIYFIRYHMMRHIDYNPFYGIKYLNEIAKLAIEKNPFISNISRNIPKLIPNAPDILHANNLHGYYFSLGSLPYLSNNFPFVYTLHDTWSFTGHCAYYFDCFKWKDGCGKCPYLKIYPPMTADYTKYYWKLKQEIYQKSKFFLVTPSKWLMDNALKSILKPAIQTYKVIPNGINTDIYYTADNKKEIKQKLGFGDTEQIALFVAAGINSPFKDYKTVKNAVIKAASSLKNITFIAIGGEKNYTENIEGINIKHIKYEKDPKKLADYYRISDVFLHGAKADNLPGVIIEALACGTPVIATDCGGIPEIVNGLKHKNNDESNTHSTDTANGILTKMQDSQDMAGAIIYLMKNKGIKEKLGQNAAKDAKIRFNQELCTTRYIEFYEEAMQYFHKIK